MIFNKKGDLLVQHDTDGFPCHLTQLPDLTGYSYFSGSLDVGPESVDGYFANGRYLVGKFFITDNKLNTVKTIDYIPTEKTKNAIGIHMHGSYVLGKNHYLLQIISLEEVMIDNTKSYVVNCILQEQKDNQVI